MIIYSVLSHFDFVAKFAIKNLNKDFTNTGRGGGHHFMKVFHKTVLFFKRWLPLCAWITRPERRGGRSPVGPKGCQLEVGAQTFSGDICFDMVVSEKVRQE